MRVFWWRLALLGGWALAVCGATANAASVYIVMSERSAGHLSVAKVIANEALHSGVAPGDVTQITPEEWGRSAPGGSPVKVIVTLGNEAFRQMLQKEPQAPIVAALVPRAGYERMLRDMGRKQQAGVSAVFLDQPIGRRVDLLKLVMPNAKRIGVLWGSESIGSEFALEQAAQIRGLTVSSSMVESPAALFGSLRTVLDDADVLLAMADPQVYSSSTIASILLATYRARVPVMAFSPAYVKAGALVAIYSTSDQIGLQTAALVRQMLHGSVAVPPQYPVEFEISVNEHVAKSLGLALDAKQLTERLQSMGRRP